MAMHMGIFSIDYDSSKSFFLLNQHHMFFCTKGREAYATAASKTDVPTPSCITNSTTSGQ
jgi:hypothetical protein